MLAGSLVILTQKVLQGLVWLFVFEQKKILYLMAINSFAADVSVINEVIYYN